MDAVGSRHVQRFGLAIVAVGLCLVASTAALAQDGSPTASAPASPLPSPEATANANGWPPIRFVGGLTDMMTVTSDCGIPGVDTFHLKAVGTDSTGWFDVTLGEYDPANLRFEGREVGQVFAPNDTVYEVDDSVAMWYDAGSGNWYLKGFWMDMVPLEDCAPPSPAAP